MSFCCVKMEGLKKNYTKDVLSIGSSLDCDIYYPEEKIAEHHCTVNIEGDEWLLDPTEANPVWVNQEKIQDTRALHNGDVVSLGKSMGPGFRVTKVVGETMAARLREMRSLNTAMMENAVKAASEKPFQRKVVNRWFNRLSKKYKTRLIQIAAVSSILFTAAGGAIYYQQAHLNRLNALASSLFYQMKEMELQIFNTGGNL